MLPALVDRGKNDAGVKLRVDISSPMGFGVSCVLKSSHITQGGPKVGLQS